MTISKDMTPYYKGFSIIELMIALAIGVIIVGISLPVYFSYTNAAKVSTSYPMIQAAEKKIATFYTQNNTFDQADNNALNINNDAQNTKVISKFYINDGIITIEYIPALSTNDTDTRPTLIFSPSYETKPSSGHVLQALASIALKVIQVQLWHSKSCKCAHWQIISQINTASLS